MKPLRDGVKRTMAALITDSRSQLSMTFGAEGAGSVIRGRVTVVGLNIMTLDRNTP